MTNGPVLEADMLMVRNRRLMGRETMAPSSLYRKDGSIITENSPSASRTAAGGQSTHG
jgi:hypothetical protein